MRWIYAATALACIGLPAQADLHVEFIEGAPKDRFVVTNVGSCALGEAMVMIDMGASKGGLIFDVTGQGAGVEVFQPFQVVSGSEFLTEAPSVTDGDTQVALQIKGMSAGEALVITTDVDDTIDAREITVTGSEFSGTTLSVNANGAEATVIFGDDRTVVAPLDAC